MLALGLVLAACGSGGGSTGNSGGDGGGGGDPGSGGGPGGPGGAGNPLDIVLDFKVENDAATTRTETILASVPFPEGAYPAGSLANMVVSGHQTAWLPLQQWADGSVKVAQAQFTDELAAGETKNYEVARDEAAMTGTFARNAWVSQFAGGLQFGAEVRDTFQVSYRAFADGAGEVLQSTPLVETRRHRVYHLPVGATGIGRDYLASNFYVTEFHDMPFVIVDWVLANDYLGADSPTGSDPNLRALGTVDVRGAWFLCKGATAVERYLPDTENIGAGQAMSGGYTGFRVMTDTYLSDAQTRRYRFVLRFEPSGATTEDLDRWRNTSTAMLDHPMYALASQQAWEQTAAGGLLGGPIPGPGDARPRAVGELGSWKGYPWFGTWGSRGDAQVTATTGTPRNQGLTHAFAHAVQGEYPALLQKLEQMAWAQAMRPYHLNGLTVGADQQILLWDGIPYLNLPGEHLGRLTIRDADPHPQYRSLSVGQPHAHDWQHFDHEHWSCDLLFEYWTVSGDAWAKEELRQLGQSLKGLMRMQYYYTAGIQPTRAEGWCMQGFAQVYQATRDDSIKTYAMRRVNEIVDVQRMKNHASKALMFQENYSGTGFPLNHRFFMPWQHGALLYGYLGAYRCWQEPILLEISEAVATTVDYSWVTNYTSPTFGYVSQGLRYYVPVESNGSPIPASYWDGLAQGIKFGDSPLGGAHTFLIAGLFILADETNDSAVRAKALQYGALLRGAAMDDNDKWDKWYYCLPSWYVP